MTTEPADKQERIWVLAQHLSALAFVLFPAFGNIMAPLVVWLIKRDESPTIREHGKTVLNFQTTWSIAVVVALFLLLYLRASLPAWQAVVTVFTVTNIVVILTGANRASRGELLRIPLSIRFFR